jgi:hypothetical protein
MVQSLSIQISQYSKKFWATWVIIPVIPALRKLRQEDYKFEASLGYIVKPCLKKKKSSFIFIFHISDFQILSAQPVTNFFNFLVYCFTIFSKVQANIHFPSYSFQSLLQKR